MKNNSGLTNPYSLSIFGLMFSLTAFGIFLTYHGSIWYGLISITFGLSFCLGFKELSASPVEVGIITVFGVKRPVLVKGLTLVCDWLPVSIIGVVKVPAITVDADFKEPFSARCIDGATISIAVSINYKPDTSDDFGVADPKTGGEKLIMYNENGESGGVDDQLREIVENLISEVAKRKGYVWMVSNKATVDGYLKMYLEGQVLPVISAELNLAADPAAVPSETLKLTSVGNIKTMGIKLISVQTRPEADADVIKADNDRVLERIQNNTDNQDISTHIQTVEKLLESNLSYRNKLIKRKKGGEDVEIPPLLSYKDAEQIVDRQKTLKAGARTEVNSTGRIVNINSAQGKKT